MADSSCAQCGGTGWREETRDGFQGVVPCDCTVQARQYRIEDDAGIPPLYRLASFDNFKLPTDNPIANAGLGQAMIAAKKYADYFPHPDRPGLLLMGEPGTGKTHLAVAAMRILLARGFECVFFDYQALLSQIRKGWDPTSNSTDREAYRSAMDAEVLLIDDLGAHRVLDWVEDTVTAIITHRCNNAKALIATTNLVDRDVSENTRERNSDLPQVSYAKTTLAERIGARARSRLFEMCKVVRMPLVEDYRLRRAGKF